MALTDPIARRLGLALETGALPPEGQVFGKRLMAQLNQPARIAVAGLPGAGKTALANMLLGADLMPDLPGVAVVELRYGASARAAALLADGQLRQAEGVLDAAHLPPGTLRVVQTLPDTRLKPFSISEIRLPESGLDDQLSLAWMASNSDIVLWCSQAFDDRERALWSTVPDHMKDHAILVLTRADRLHMKGELASRITRLQPVVADEFLRLCPVATLQAAAARAAASGPNAALWLSSGGKALHDGILHQVDMARMADLDRASMLLDRYKVAAGLPEPAQPPLQARPRTLSQPVPQLAPQPRPAQPRPAQPRIAQSPADTVIDRALGLLQTCAQDLMAAPDLTSGAGADLILDRCTAAASDVARLLSETEGLTPGLDLLRDDAIEGEQMLMLLRLERGETASADALTVVLQMKKDLSERVVP